MQKLFVTAVALVALNASAYAQFLSGAINFAGGVTLNGTAATATAVDFGASLTTAPNTGSYAVVPAGVAVTFTDFSFAFSFAPFVAPGTLWSLTHLGINYSFTQTTQEAPVRDTVGLTQSVILEGMGIAKATGFLDTPGAWIVTVNSADASVTFSFSASSSAIPPPTIPDGGTSVLLLGAALSMLGFIRKLTS
jgi:hypothetical protein